ncbi:MAG TPA: phage tail protein [Aliiroseovarius sp.]|nr:phage tail protein [Aliiroseovarius sp.]
MTNAISGYDTGLAIHDGGSPGTFDDIAELISITPPNAQRAEIDATHMKSPNSTRESIAGLIEPGEFSFEIAWIPSDATDTIIQALITSGAVRQIRITFPNSVTATFSAFLKGIEPSVPLDDRMTAAVTAKVTTTITFA